MSDTRAALDAAANEVEAAMARWATLQAEYAAEQSGQEVGQLIPTAMVWAAETADMDAPGFVGLWVGCPPAQSVSATGGLGLYLSNRFLST